MASTTARRPLPALIAVVLLLVLTALVWWRVLSRDDTDAKAASPCPTPTVTAPAAATTLPPPARVPVVVLNGTQRNGLGARTLKTLLSRGFTSTKAAGNYTRKPKITGTALLRSGPSGRSNVALVRYYFPRASVQVVRSAPTATVTIILGAKYRQVSSAVAVRRALAAARATLAPAPSPTRAGATASSTRAC